MLTCLCRAPGGAGHTDQAALLKNSDPKLAANKKLAYDFFRVVLRARHLDQAEKFMTDGYIQHNPNAETGIKGFKDFFTRLGPPQAIEATVPGLVAIQAEGDYVTLSSCASTTTLKTRARSTPPPGSICSVS